MYIAPQADLARECWSWFVSCILVFTLVLLLVVIHTMAVRPMEFFYVLF